MPTRKHTEEDRDRMMPALPGEPTNQSPPKKRHGHRFKLLPSCLTCENMQASPETINGIEIPFITCTENFICTDTEKEIIKNLLPMFYKEPKS